jgi:hypothetical protein
MHHLLAMLAGALAGAVSAAVPIYAYAIDPPEEVLVPDESVVV